MLSLFNVILSCIAGYFIGAVAANITKNALLRGLCLLTGILIVTLIAMFFQINWASLDNPFTHLRW